MQKLTLREYLDQQEEHYQDDDCNSVAEYVGSLGHGEADQDEILRDFILELDDEKLDALIDYFKPELSTNEILKILVDSSDLESGSVYHRDYTLFYINCGEIDVEYEGELHHIDCNDIVWRLIVDIDEAITRFENKLPRAVAYLVDAYGGDI